MEVVVSLPYVPPLARFFKRWKTRWYADQVLPIGDARIHGAKILRPPGVWFQPYEPNAYYFGSRDLITRLHGRRPFDVFLSVNMVPDACAGVRIARQLGIPSASLGIGADIMEWPEWHPKDTKVVVDMLERSDQCFGVSQRICDRMKEFAPNIRDPIVAYWSCDTTKFVPADDKQALRKKLGWRMDAVIGLFVGYLIPRKGVRELLEAARAVVRRHRNFQLVLVGEGFLREWVESFCAEHNLRDNVLLTGGIDPQRMPDHFAAADMLVLPTYSEGMPNVLIEAMSCGLPAVTTPVGGVPELTEPERNGLLVPAKSTKELADAMQRMIENPPLLESWGKAAREKIVANFDRMTNARKFHGHLEELVSRYRAPGEKALRPRARKRICILGSSHHVLHTRMFQRETISIRKAYQDVTVIAHHDRLHDVVDRVRVIGFAPRAGRRLTRMERIRLLGKAWRRARELRADVYHAHDPEGFLIGALLKLIYGSRFVLDAWENYQWMAAATLSGWKSGLLESLTVVFLKWTSRLADHVIVVSWTTEEFYRRQCGCRNVTRIYNSPPVEAFPLGQDDAETARTLCHEGTFTYDRGMVQLFDALEIVHRQEPGVRLIVVGGPTPREKEYYERRTGDGVLKEVVQSAGWLPYWEMGPVIAKAGIGLVTMQPLPNNYGSLSNKIFDYMACGQAIIVPRNSDSAKLVEKYKCGVAIDATNPQEIATAVLDLIRAPKRRREMGLRGRAAVENDLGWHQMEKQLHEIYADILKTPRTDYSRFLPAD